MTYPTPNPNPLRIDVIFRRPDTNKGGANYKERKEKKRGHLITHRAALIWSRTSQNPRFPLTGFRSARPLQPVPRPSTTTMTYCRPHARYACQSMLNEALTSCELGPPYLLSCADKRQREKGQPGQQLTGGRGQKSAYTRKSTGYFVRPESSMCGGRNSTAFSSARQKKVKREKKPDLLTGGGEEQANRLKNE